MHCSTTTVRTSVFYRTESTIPTSAELVILIEAQDRASNQLQQVGAQVTRLERQVEGVRRQGGGGGLMGALTGGLGVGAGMQAIERAIGGIGGVFRFITESIFDLNSSLERTVATFTSLTGSAAAARDVVQALRREAAVSPFSDQEVLAAGRALVSSSQASTESLLELIRVAEQLAAIDPAQGLEGAAFALREALGGSFESLIQRFEISREAINRFRAQGLTGLQVVTAALREMGVGADIVERLGRTFEGRLTTIQAFGNELRRSLGAGIFERVSDLVGRVVRLIDQYRDRLLGWAEQIGAAIGAVAEHLASRFLGPLLALLDRLAPGLREVVEGALQQAPEAVEQLDRAQQQAAQSGESLERQLARVGVAAAELQLEAGRVRRSYDDQLEPLQRQLRLLQQSADLQRVQNALATNRATVEGIRLQQEITALQRAARGQEDPNAAGLTVRQRAIALALQERRLRQEELGLTEQQRPAIQNLEQQIAAIQEQQRQALEPLERQLAIRREEADWLQLQRQQQQLATQELEAGVKRASDAWTTLKNSPEALENARQRGEELAREWLKGFQQWVDQFAGGLWVWIVRSFRKWYDEGGKQQLDTLAAEVGTNIATAIGAALQSTLANELRRRVEDAIAGSSASQIADEVIRRQFGSPEAGGATGGGGSGFGGPGMNVNVNVNGADPGVRERLQAALTDFLRQFFATQAATDPGASPALQGAGRAP